LLRCSMKKISNVEGGFEDWALGVAWRGEEWMEASDSMMEDSLELDMRRLET